MSNNHTKNNFQRGTCVGRGGHQKRDQKKKSNFQLKKPFGKKVKEENRKELSLFKKEAKENKDFKVTLGGDNIENIILPTYKDDDRDKTLLILAKEFNMIIEDGYLFKEESIREEENRTVLQV